MHTLVKSTFNYLSFLISPPFCSSCKTFLQKREIFCEYCFDLIKPVVSTSVSITAKHSMRVFSISDYQEPLKSLILAKKWSDRLASKYLAELIWEETYLKNIDFDYLIPIPLHWSRTIKRGYNQAEVISDILSIKSGKPSLNILQRAKATQYQSELSIEQRSINVKDAFNLKPNKFDLENKNIILVDDLMTTGSTLKSAAKVLLTQKPASINAVVACRVI